MYWSHLLWHWTFHPLQLKKWTGCYNISRKSATHTLAHSQDMPVDHDVDIRPWPTINKVIQISVKGHLYDTAFHTFKTLHVLSFWEKIPKTSKCRDSLCFYILTYITYTVTAGSFNWLLLIFPIFNFQNILQGPDTTKYHQI